MIIKKLFLILSGCFATACFAQKIDVKQFDTKKASTLLRQKINTFREESTVEPLSQDPVLQQAAQHHADYLQEKRLLSHYESQKKYHDPVARVYAFGGKHTVILENVAFHDLFRPVTKETGVTLVESYEELAIALAQDWKNSEGHYKNIVNENVELTGIGIALDPEKERVYAVQVFGRKGEYEKTPLPQNKDTYGIKFPENDYGKYCKACDELLRFMPADVKFGLQLDQNDIYFVMNDERYFAMLMQDKHDGIAVDVLSKNQFPCGEENKLANSKLHRGFLLEPVYLKDVKNNIKKDAMGNIVFPVGTLPEYYRNKPVELNLLLLQNKRLCQYTAFFDIPGHKWDLVKMGLFIDTLPDQELSPAQRTLINEKSLTFTIPFQKNQFVFEEKDIQPLYDSLSLKDFIIEDITIRAYSSVEGPEDRNIVLQTKRAESIIKALEDIQKSKIRADVKAAENWVDFFTDIAQSEHEKLQNKSKREIKEDLERNNLKETLEPILSQHRKAIVTVNVRFKREVEIQSKDEAIRLFSNAVDKKDVQQALKIQQDIFHMIDEQILAPALIDELEIPKENQFGLLRSNFIAYQLQKSNKALDKALDELTELAQRLPDNKYIQYNWIVLKIKSIVAHPEQITKEKDLPEEIKNLKRMGISPSLINRLMVNYHILRSEYYLFQRKYREKDRSVSFVYQHYKQLDLDDKDLLNLAQYLSDYSKYHWAKEMLVDKVQTIDVNEDLLFYFINLTITDPEMTKKEHYRKIMLNAINVNPQRFCSLFDPYGTGGITFQLLDDQYLKNTYCENCEKGRY